VRGESNEFEMELAHPRDTYSDGKGFFNSDGKGFF
jgi:hypothetical protein